MREDEGRASPGRGSGTISGSGRRRFLAFLGLLLCAAAGFWFVVIPYPRGLDTRAPRTTALMEQRKAEAGGDSLALHQEWVPLERISPNLRRAVVVAEDYRFHEHDGIDWISLAEEVEWSGDDDFSWLSPSDLAALLDALGYVWANRDELRGRSTVTQQLAKNLYFGTERSLLRKAMEAVVARRLERHLTKDRILELYLNIAEWGPGVFGAEAAARTYFGRPASQLTLDQAAALAGTLPHPLTSNPAHDPGRMLWRQRLVLDRIDPEGRMPTEPMPLPTPLPELDPRVPDVPVDLEPSDPRGIALPDTVVPVRGDSLGPAGVPGIPPATGASPDTGIAPDTLPAPDSVARTPSTPNPMLVSPEPPPPG